MSRSALPVDVGGRETALAVRGTDMVSLLRAEVFVATASVTVAVAAAAAGSGSTSPGSGAAWIVADFRSSINRASLSLLRKQNKTKRTGT